MLVVFSVLFCILVVCVSPCVRQSLLELFSHSMAAIHLSLFLCNVYVSPLLFMCNVYVGQLLFLCHPV